MTREEAILMIKGHKFSKPTEKWQELNNEALDMAIKALNDWTEYSDKLWKIAYERGKAEALNECTETEPTNALKETETKEHDDLAKPCENLAKDCKTDLISRADLFRELTIDAYGMFDAEDGIVLAVPLDIITHEIDNAPSVSAEPQSKVDTTENPKCDFTSAERQPEPRAELVTLPGSWLDDEDGTVICSECESEFYYGDDDELGDLFKQYRFCPECGHRMTDDDRWRISKQSILKRIIEQFEDHEQQAKDKPHGLKEYAVWKQAAREVEEYMKARGYER